MIYLFGSTGMLGNYVKTVLSKKFELNCITRSDYDILQDNFKKLNNIMNNIQEQDIIINCTGIIPQKTANDEHGKYIKVNTLFPHKLQNISEKVNANFIHITTDCVFDGKKGSSYDENSIHTETNMYGTSKSLGEPENATIIRTSIIGEELFHKKGLLEWVKSNKNRTIQGYGNHLWNGVTCLTLANIIKKIINDKLFWTGVRHIHSQDIVSKYELCCYINEIYNLNMTIQDFPTETVNKTLKSIYESTFEIPNIKNQIYLQYLLNKRIHILGKNSFIGKNLYDLILNENIYIYSHSELKRFAENVKDDDIVINCWGFHKNIYDKLYEVNVIFLGKIINIINNFKNIKLIHLSSLQLSEINNNSNYVKTKQLGEELIKKKLNNNNTYKSLRLCNTYGFNHINPYNNSFIGTLIYEKQNNIKKIYTIKKDEMYILNIDKLPNIIYNLMADNDNMIHNVISQKTTLFNIISYLFDEMYIQKYFIIVDGSKKNIIECNNIVIDDKIIN